MLHSCALQNVVLAKCVYGELNEYASFIRVTECSVNKICVCSTFLRGIKS